MALVQQIKDGQIVESASQSSLSGNTSTGNSVDKDSFLQLLVAQMQYQDPLQPTSNTEYISQYAQFSQVEELQNMGSNMTLMRASTLVGQEVYIKTTSSSGETNYVRGKVDYVVYENNKAYLSIDEELYSIDDLDTVADKEYLAAFDKAYDFNIAIKKLPTVTALSLADASKVDELEKTYNSMNEYEKSFVANSVKEALDKYIERVKELRLAQEQTTEENPDADVVDDDTVEEV